MPELDPKLWLDIGISGAALFIVLVLVIQMFRQQAKSVDKLCGKIDALVDSFANNNIRLNEVIITNDRDQQELIRCFHTLNDLTQDMHKRIIRIDTRLYEQRKYYQTGQPNIDDIDNLPPLSDYDRAKNNKED